MPDRIIKESICTSDTLDKLTWFEEVFWHRLTVNCDDFGRFDARPAILKSRLFPLKTNVTDKSIKDALNTLSTVGLVTLYEHEGKPLLQLVTWGKYQRMRAAKSKYPAPDNKITHVADTCRQMPASCGQSPSNAPECESECDILPPLPPTGGYSADFLAFWAAYPKKVGKGAAAKAFGKVKGAKQLLPAMLAAIEAQAKSDQWHRDNGQYIPNPSTWLNQRRWEDEATTQEGKSGRYESW